MEFLEEMSTIYQIVVYADSSKDESDYLIN